MKPIQNARIGAILLGLVLLTTLKHSAFSYLEITPVKFGYLFLDWLYSIAVVLVLDAAILYASYRGRIDLARIAAVTVGALSLAAFWSTDEEFTLTQWVAVVAFSVIIPYLQYELAEIFAADLHRADDYLLRGERIESLTAERDQAVNRIAVLDQARAQDQERIATLRAEMEASRGNMGSELEAAKKLIVSLRSEVAQAHATEQGQAERDKEAVAKLDQIIREQDVEIDVLHKDRDALARERDALRTDLHTMTGARDQAVKDRDNWKATARLLEPYKALRTALLSGPVTLGRNQILVPDRTIAKDGTVVPFRIANNNDPALKKDLAESE